MTGPVVVGPPSADLLEIVRSLPTPGTVAWSDPADLRAASDALGEVGWEALVVDPDDEPLSTAAMSHRSQIHGVPGCVVVHCVSGVPVERVATMTLRHLPEVPVLLVGPEARAAREALAEVIVDLELSVDMAVDVDGARRFIDALEEQRSIPLPSPRLEGS
jgi:hypothetical protein